MGHLTTHVLDTKAGVPAEGIRIELFSLGNNKSEAIHIKSLTTNADGRGDSPLLDGNEIRSGRFELRFHVGEYFAQQESLPFLDVVPVQFAIADPDANYHVPLLVSPWSYTTYRGS